MLTNEYRKQQPAKDRSCFSAILLAIVRNTMNFECSRVNFSREFPWLNEYENPSAELKSARLSDGKNERPRRERVEEGEPAVREWSMTYMRVVFVDPGLIVGRVPSIQRHFRATRVPFRPHLWIWPSSFCRAGAAVKHNTTCSAPGRRLGRYALILPGAEGRG